MQNVLIALLLSGTFVYAQQGALREGLPDWYERTLYTLVNAARMDPVSYGAAYVSGGNPVQSYTAREPLMMHHDLNRAARAHCEDMVSCGRMSHTSCDGTEFQDRIKRYYGASNAQMECVAEWYQTPAAALSMWLNSDMGHRDAVMTEWNVDLGCGHAEGQKHYWTLDFAQSKKTQNHPYYGGTHRFSSSSQIAFLVNYSDASGGAPQTAQVVIEGVEKQLSHILGSSGKGTYRFETDRRSACRAYYFKFTDSKGDTWRLPGTGEYWTFGEGSCEDDYSSDVTMSARELWGAGASCLIRYIPGGVMLSRSGIRSVEIVSASGRIRDAVGSCAVQNHGDKTFVPLTGLGPSIYVLKAATDYEQVVLRVVVR